jgi:preprotein translocase subunit SecD
VLLFGIMALTSTWKPKLGLDLRGGTTITLTASAASGGGEVTADKMAEAKNIIEQRVNGAGIGESETTISGGNHIQVAVPGVNQESLVRQVGQTALLRFRIVYGASAGTPQPTPTPTPTKPGTTPTAKPSGKPSTPATNPTVKPSSKPSSTPTPNGRAWTSVLGDRASAAPTPTPTAPATTPTTPPATTPTTPQPSQPVDNNDPMTWQPDAATQQAFQAYVCDPKKSPPDDPKKPLITCDRENGNKFLLGPAIMEGTDLEDAFAGVPQGKFQWQVNLKFTGAGGDRFLKATTAISQRPQGENLFAIVLDSKVISTPSVQNPIPGGQAEITGTFSEAEARDLANVLKYGALPLAFSTDEVSNVSPQLGNDQLRAGILAGVIGLAIVVLFSFLYYRGLGLVVVLSLAVAAALTYSSVVLLGKSMGFTLTLAGIAGLIVAIGITADSFVVFFERLRDEVRDGRSLRSSVETGWARARHTIIAADSITLLASIVLYLLAVGGVKGFAFALGLTTAIDLVVVFFFTKPLVSVLARTNFFGHGHRLSGLDPESLGVQRLPGQMNPKQRARLAGGEA